MKKSILICIAIWVCSFTTKAQSLSELTHLVGTWKGEGSQSMPNSEKVTFNQTENVSAMLNDQLLVIHGIGTNKVSGEKGFEAYGVMYYDEVEKGYFINAWTHENRFTRASVDITDEGFNWQFNVPGGTVRYTATITTDTWNEKGEFSPDGNQWYPFMAMSLQKQ